MPTLMFSFEERKQIAADYRAGASLQQVATKYHTTDSAIQRIVEREGGLRPWDKAPSAKKPIIRPTGYRPGEKNKNEPRVGLLSWLES